MSMTISIAAIALVYLLTRAAAYLPCLIALVIASVTGSVFVRRKRRSDAALLNRAATIVIDRWQRNTLNERRLLRHALRNTMRLTVHRSLFPDVRSFWGVVS